MNIELLGFIWILVLGAWDLIKDLGLTEAGARLYLKSAGLEKGGIFLNPKPGEFTMRFLKIYFLGLTHIFL
ncbi:MAG: hypothetical protein NT175_00105 [Bacteroidetes bacterium]|nr:hypothetical protein [Bacteroidota bacterium]